MNLISARVHCIRWRLIACLMCLFSAALQAGEGPAPGPAPIPPPPKVPPTPTDLDEDSPPAPEKQRIALPAGVDWDAQRQSYREEEGAFVLSGNAFVRFQGIKLEADNIVFYRETQEVYAEGHIRLRIGESEVAAEVAYIDKPNDVGYLVDAVVRVSAPPEALDGFTRKSAEEKQREEREARDEIRQLSPDKLGVENIREKDPFGVYVDPRNDPQARANLIFKAGKIIYHNRMHLSAEDAFITSDDMVHPLYGVGAGKLDFYLKEVPVPEQPGKTQLKPQKIQVRRGHINILGVNTFPFPTISYDLMQKNVYYSLNSGNSKRWGPFGMLRLGYGLGGGENQLFDPTRVYLDLEERYKRGPGGGGALEWQTGYRPPEALQEDGRGRFERGMGHLRVWAIDEIQTNEFDDVVRARRDLERRIQPKIDGFPRRRFDANILFTKRRKLMDAGPPSFDIDTHRDEWRGLIDFAHHQPLKRFAGIDNLVLDAVYERETDRDVKLEYFQNQYMADNQPEGLLSLRKPGDNYSIELLYRGNPQDFDAAPPRSPVDYGTFTGYQPALTYSLVPTPIYKGFVVTGEVQGARLHRDFERAIYDQAGFDANRVYMKMDLSRPFKLGALNIVPHLGTQQQAYDNSREGGSVYQGAITYGIDATSRFYGTFPDFENEALGIRGMRHIVEPRISYDVVGDTRESAEDLLDFDRIDDLTPVEKLTFALDQTFQTRRPAEGGGTRAANIGGFNMAVDLYPRTRDQERLLDGDHFDLFRIDGFLRVLDVFRFDGSLGFSLEDGKMEKAAYGIEIDPQTRWKLRFEERFNFRDRSASREILGSDQFHLRFDYELSERWGLSVERIQERRKSVLARKGRQVERITLTRHYGALDAGFTYAVDRNIGESTYYFTVRPAFVYRNLIVPTHDLLVDSAEVNGEYETPEENNFNPFDLLRKKKKKPGPAKKGDVLPPLPPSAPGEEGIPTPPPPTPDKRATIRGGDREAAGVFEDPDAPSRPSSKMDDDDWSLPPSEPQPLPASTR